MVSFFILLYLKLKTILGKNKPPGISLSLSLTRLKNEYMFKKKNL